MARCRCAPGLACIPSSRTMPRGTRTTRPVVRGALVLVEVSRLPGLARPWQALWLWWAGPGTPDLGVLAPGVHPALR